MLLLKNYTGKEFPVNKSAFKQIGYLLYRQIEATIKLQNFLYLIIN